MSFEPEDLNFKILYACVKYLKGRMDDGINFMTDFIFNEGIKKTNYNFNIILAFFYKEKGKDLLFKKHMEAAKKQRLKLEPGYAAPKSKIKSIILTIQVINYRKEKWRKNLYFPLKN